MRKLLVGILILLGISGLVLGLLGETTFAPNSEYTATADLSQAQAAGADSVILIDPGVFYVGGSEGTLNVTAPADTELRMVRTTLVNAEAFLTNTPYTRITDVQAWDTLTTSIGNPEGEASAQGIADSDLWNQVSVVSGEQVNLADFATQEVDAETARAYQATLLFTDGESPAVEALSITWPSNQSNAWVPFAYALGAIFLILGLVLLYWLVLRRADSEAEVEENPENNEYDVATEVATEQVATVAGDSVAESEITEISTEPGLAEMAPLSTAVLEELEPDIAQPEIDTVFEEQKQMQIVPGGRGRRRAANPVEDADPTIPAAPRSGRRKAELKDSKSSSSEFIN